LAGRIYYAFNDVSQAEACWQTCLQQHPGFDEPRCALAEAAWEHGDFERAVEQLSPLVAANPRLDQKQVFFFADALLNLGRPAEAAAALERTAAYAALPPFGLFLLAHARLECGEYERARQQFEAVLAANPQSANAHFGLATVYTRLGQTDQARQHRERYAQLRSDELADSARLRPEMRKADWADPIPVLRESYLNAGKVCAAEARLVDAEKFWLRAAELDPRSPRPRQLLELLYAGQGRHAEAARMKTLGLAESR
jgi:tetratricopeptide (TPR) repeat protein